MELWFEDKYNIFSFNTDPTFMGHCTNRRRKFTWCIRKDLEFTGSEHEFMVMFDPTQLPMVQSSTARRRATCRQACTYFAQALS